ncbi:hypothetical protein RYZ27_11500 [Hyphomonas sp. FCG-A18]|uniref:hypothetical protein n=1 Tax=Hyphomonas sp. FCG-A18 TaxID=3080019 RepID=UPI002B2C9A5B|nr:hypothetical protein RYZ27_11500 [Hyphomonas sp. FCG-A18]
MLSTLARHAHIPLGAILVVFGIWTFTDPAVLHHYRVDTSQPNARIALRAIIGGGELGLGFTLAAGKFLKLDRRTLNFIAAIVFLSVGLCRLLAAFLEPYSLVGIQPWREGVVELLLSAAALLGYLSADEYPN